MVIECKDLSFDKTFGEIARRLAKYKGEVNAKGKRDELKRHIDRCVDLENSRDELSQFVGFQIEKIERVLLFSGITPIQFSKAMQEHNIVTCTFDSISKQYAFEYES